MGELPPTSSNSWDYSTYIEDSGWTEIVMPNNGLLQTQDENFLFSEHENPSYLHVSPDATSQVWMNSSLDSGMAYSGVDSSTSTLSSYPESSMYNSENLVSTIFNDIMILV
jgi:hypothetical protein